MNAIVTLAGLRDRLGLMDDAGVNASVSSALFAGKVMAETALGSEFSLIAREEVFYIDIDTQVAIDGLYSLRLRSGFVKADPAPEIYAGSTIAEITDSVEPAPLINYEGGFVLVPEGYANQYIKVKYTSGLADEDTAPPWLSELVLGLSAKVLSFQQIADGKPELSETFKFIDRNNAALLDRHMRKDSSAIYPLV